MLELIDKGEVTQAHPVPLLFVHGAWHAAWCWDDHFLDFFADGGFRAIAVSLQGHGASTVSRRSAGFRDHVADIRTVAALLGSEPVLLGHSLGALVVQKYLEEGRTPAAVLLAPHPPQPTRRAVVALRASLRHPVRVIQSMTIGTFADMVNTPRLAREAFFSSSTPQAIVESCARRMESGSRRAATGSMFVRIKTARVATPLLVLDGEQDANLTRDEARATACAYQAQAAFIPDMGHDMMLEPGWRVVAESIESFLISKGL